MQPPFVDPENLFRLVQFFDILAAVVFAVSGSLVASRKNLDVMGVHVIRGHHRGGRGQSSGLPVFRESTKRERWGSVPRDLPKE